MKMPMINVTVTFIAVQALMILISKTPARNAV